MSAQILPSPVPVGPRPVFPLPAPAGWLSLSSLKEPGPVVLLMDDEREISAAITRKGPCSGLCCDGIDFRRVRGWRRAEAPGQVAAVLSEVGRERLRQCDALGFDAKHDDCHRGGGLLALATAYVMSARGQTPMGLPEGFGRFRAAKSHREDLIRAAAVIVAEVERLDRLRAECGEENGV